MDTGVGHAGAMSLGRSESAHLTRELEQWRSRSTSPVRRFPGSSACCLSHRGNAGGYTFFVKNKPFYLNLRAYLPREAIRRASGSRRRSQSTSRV